MYDMVFVVGTACGPFGVRFSGVRLGLVVDFVMVLKMRSLVKVLRCNGYYLVDYLLRLSVATTVHQVIFLWSVRLLLLCLLLLVTI